MKKLLLSLCAVIVATIAFAAEQTASFTTTNKALPATQGQITITPAAGTGNTPGGSTSAQYRLYSGNTLTICAATGYEITNVTSTASSDGYKLISTRATANAGTIVDNGITLSTPVQELVLTFTAEVRFKSITVTYVEASGPAKTAVTLTWSRESDSLNFGDEFTAPTLSIEPAEAAGAVAYESSNPNLLYIDAEGNMTLTPNVEGTAEVTASIDSSNETYKSNTATYTLTVKDPNNVVYSDAITHASFALAASYGLKDYTSEATKVTYYAKAMKGTSNSIQINSSATSSGKNSGVVSTANPSNLAIEKIIVTTNTDATDKMTVQAGNQPGSFTESSTVANQAVACPTDGVTLTAAVSGDKKTYTYIPEEEYKYFGITSSGAVYITNLEVIYKPGTPEKPAAELTFSEDVVTVEEGTEEFEAPVLTYPEGLTITYASSDVDVALVDEKTGYVVIGNAGTATITATSEATDEYRSSSASYTIHVTEKPKTPSQLAWSATEWSVMEGTTNITDAPELTNTLGIDVVYTSSDEEVAMIDENGAIVLMGKVGSTVIKAAPADTDTYSGDVSYTLTVTAKPVLGAITLNGTAVEDGLTYTFTEGTELVFAVENADMLQIEAVTNDETNTAAFEFLDEAATATWTNAAIGSYVVSVETTGFGQEDSAIFTIEVTEKPAISLVADFIFAGDNANVTTMASKPIEPTTSTVNGNANDLDGVTFTADNGVTMVINVSGTENHPRYWTNTKTGNEARMYKGNELTISAPESYKLISIEFTKGGGNSWNMTDMSELLWTNNKAVVKSVTFETGGRSDIGAVTVTIADENTPEVPVIEIDGKVITDFEESIDLNRGTKIVTLTAAEGHHIYHKHVESPATEAASLYAAEPADDFTHVESNVATTEISTNGTLHFYAQHAESGMKSAVQTLTFHGDSTAIFEIEAAESAASEWFDLQGRRVAAPAKGGVYILKQGSKVSKRAI